MPSRIPRRSFVAPFVITFPLVACHHGAPEPIHDNPPMQPTPPPVDAATTNTAPMDPVSAAPPDAAPPDATPQLPTTAGQWTLQREADGTCVAIDTGACRATPGKPRPCTPPPPKAIPCPFMLGTIAGSTVDVSRYAGRTDCVIDEPPISCPRGAMCNPPPPSRIGCPE